MANPFAPVKPFGTRPVEAAEPVKAVEVDHLSEIAELARGLHHVSPSGAQTVSDKILEHVGALQGASK